MSDTYNDFLVRPNTPKEKRKLLELRDSFLAEGIKSKIVPRQGRTREMIVLQTHSKNYDDIKKMGIV